MHKVSHGSEETEAFAERLASYCCSGDVIALAGPLGSGKTCFVRGLVRGLGSDDRVHSPSFTLQNEYHGRFHIHHFDLYRLNHADEINDIGLYEMITDAGPEPPELFVIEWANRFPLQFSPQQICVTLSYGPEENDRCINIADSDIDRRGQKFREFLRGEMKQ